MLNQATIDKIVAAAKTSDLARFSWTGRGPAPIGYIEGMALVYGLCVQKLMSRDSAALAMVRVVDGKDEHDVFDHYEPDLRAIKVVTDGAPDLDRLRALFLVLTGLAMRESSGGDDIGQDAGAPENRTAEKAEAGLFQSSWNLRAANPTEIRKLFDYYSAHPDEGFADIFRTGTHPRPGAMRNYGDGDGAKFQELSKTCPAFAVQTAAVGARTLYTHWGPLIHEAAQVRPEADKLFKQVQVIVGADVPVSGQKPAAGWLSALVAVVLAMFRKPAKGQAPAAAPVAGTPWMPWAIKEVGFHETGVNLGTEKYIDLSKNGSRAQLLGEPWCADFSNAAFEVVGIRGTRSAMARSYEHSEYFVELDGPAYGAVTTMWRGSPDSDQGHVFFYLGENEKGVYGLGGNQSDSVSREYHPRNRIVGYWWPKSLPLPKIGPIAVTADAQKGSET